MKKVNFLAALCCLLLASCQVEQDEVIENNANLTTTVAPQLGPGGLQQPDPDDDSVEEQSLAWAAYTAGSVLYKNSVIQQELAPFLNSSTKSLSLDLLLGPNSQTPLFRARFMSRFQLFVDCSLGNVAGDDCPGGSNSPGDPACPPCTGLSAGAEAQAFVDYLVNENCLEFYLPRGFQFALSDELTTAAHSMNDVFHTNKGFLFENSGFHPIPQNAISPSYVQTRGHTFIIGRPVRAGLNSQCSYSEFNVNDFEDFLYGTWPFGQ